MNRLEPGARSVAVTDYLAAKLCQVAIEDGLELDAVFSSIINPVLGSLLDAARDNSLTPRQASMIKAMLLEGHVFCVLCVLILELDAAVGEQLDALRDHVLSALVDAVFGSGPTGYLSPAARVIVIRALTAGVNRGLAAVKAASGPDTAIQSVQLVGLITCPDLEKHPKDAVYTMCLKPLAAAFLSEEISKWIENRFQGRLSAAVGRAAREDEAEALPDVV